jgi:hypothetical protein
MASYMQALSTVHVLYTLRQLYKLRQEHGTAAAKNKCLGHRIANLDITCEHGMMVASHNAICSCINAYQLCAYRTVVVVLPRCQSVADSMHAQSRAACMQPM